MVLIKRTADGEVELEGVALESTATEAVANAEVAALAASMVLETLLLHNENVSYLYPEEVDATCTLTAGDGVDTFSAWAEIVDSEAHTLSSKFIADDGYLIEIMTHDYSAANEIYIIEIAYGDDKIVVGRARVRSDWTYVRTLRSARIPEGEAVYYRMKAETALATLQADFRYYLRT